MEAFLEASKKHTSVSTGQALFRGENLLEASKRRLRALRGSEISMIFQDPMTSLNPVLSVGNQLVEAVMLHRDVTQREARELAIAGLQEVGIPRAERRVDDYPHQFSGGMRQRVMIAMALINDPDLLIADEPTTALDVTTQAQILTLMKRLQEDFGSAIIMITHDLGVIAEIADEGGDAAGEVVETRGYLSLVGAFVDVMVPVAGFGERDLEADLRLRERAPRYRDRPPSGRPWRPRTRRPGWARYRSSRNPFPRAAHGTPVRSARQRRSRPTTPCWTGPLPAPRPGLRRRRRRSDRQASARGTPRRSPSACHPRD